MNMPVHNFRYDRDINTQWVQTVTVGASGIHFDTAQRMAGINSESINLNYVNYVLPVLGVGATFSAYAPYRTLIPSYETGADAWWSYYNYAVPLSFILSLRLLHSRYFTFGLNLYPVSWPFIIGSISLIGTVHLFWNIDVNANLHCNPTLAYVLHWNNDYGYFNEYDLSLTQSIRLRNTSNKIFYSLAFESYRGINEQNYTLVSKRPDFRLGVNMGYLFGSPQRRFGAVRGEKDWFFTWPQPGYKKD
jgi:hypothetical protein